MTTRRSFLAGAGAVAVTGLAGCGALDGPRGEDTPSIDSSEFQDGLPPLPTTAAPLPITIPASLVDPHRRRARELVESVPADPSIPNGVVAREIDRDQDRVQQRLESGSDATFEIDVLRDWRHTRGNAANLLGSYRAATGNDDGEAVSERRTAVREDLGAFTADLEYRASDPVEAVLVYATLENLLEDVRRQARPERPYPESPIDAVEQAGRAVEETEDAESSLADARAIHQQYLDRRDTTESQWSTLIEGTRVLSIATDTTRQTLDGYQEYEAETVFDRDVGRVAARLFRDASRRVQSGEGAIGEYRRRGDGAFASALLEAGRDLAAMAVYRSVYRAIEDDDVNEDVTASSIRSSAADARSAIAALEEADYPHLSVAIARAGMGGYDDARRSLDERYFDAEDAEASLRYATMYARVAPEAATYLVERLRTVTE
ncbi:Uncharacterized protein HSRCO_0302 [Halanaeroarchaeum sp. HSR-CO]|uniref:hypothetical protein n=1 Tax=Halanaeroarchaeum sp. HSR-CO TaxID=2866382 RepID=UPI00217D7938|nr:hypothetical protein [Halanaeroarchaeum sp. HSR-CO]UWG46601.1 Uncharacterized protein HSRCO_0302 [Halanaeroarchaeum sp. HSR-CO]